jgi:hypothetical protein
MKWAKVLARSGEIRQSRTPIVRQNNNNQQEEQYGTFHKSPTGMEQVYEKNVLLLFLIIYQHDRIGCSDSD